MDHLENQNPGEMPQSNILPESFGLRVPEDLPVVPPEPEQVPVAMEPLFPQEPKQEMPCEDVRPEDEAGDDVSREKPKKKKKGGKAVLRILSAAAALAILFGCCFATGWIINDRWEDRAEQMRQDFDAQLNTVSSRFNSKLDVLQEQLENANTATRPSDGVINVIPGEQLPGLVYSQNVSSVVQVTCQITTTYYGQTSTGTSSGSGFVLTENGYVVTNYHVVQGANSVSFTMDNGTVYEAKVIGYDESNDVALLKAEAAGLRPVRIGRSDALAVGDQVVAIGFPLSAQDATLTVGYISAKNRDVNTSGVAINMLQTDAAINSGNSGGPLFNMAGEVIGITTAKYSGTTSSGASIEGIGFAIPMDDVISILSDLMTYGYINSAYLGVLVRNMNETELAAAQLYDFPVGVYVEDVTEGYCAQKAGIQPKDIIIELGGYEIENMTELTRVLRKFKGGDLTTVTVFRGGQEVVLNITLDNKPAQTQTPEEPAKPDGMPEDGSFEEWYDYFFGDGNKE